MREHGVSFSWFHQQKRGTLAPQAPIIVVAPQATPTAALVGDTITCTDGTWSAYPLPITFTYQWQRDGVAIGGATANTYVAVSADLNHILTCVVTATNATGSTPRTSNNVSILSAFQPVNTVTPTIVGTTAVGSTVSCNPGTWDVGPFDAPTFAYQWRLNGTDISGATAQTYLIQSGDGGGSLTCRVSASNSQGTSSALSTARSVDAAPFVIVDATITGTPSVGATLTLAQGTWGGYPVPALANQWLRDGADIAGQTGGTYLVVSGDSGKDIACRVTGTNALGSASSVSNGFIIGAALSAPVNTTPPAISGTPQVNQTLSSTSGVWSGNPTPTYSYQWFKNGAFLSNGNAGNTSQLTLSAGFGLVAGDIITSKVTATNSQGSATTASNGLTFQNTPAAPTNSVAPTVTPTVSYGDGKLLTCNPGTWAGWPVPTLTYQWRRNGTDIAGATSSTYTTQAADLVTTVSCAVTGTNSQGALTVSSNDVEVTANNARLLLEDGVSYLLLENGGYLMLE